MNQRQYVQKQLELERRLLQIHRERMDAYEKVDKEFAGRLKNVKRAIKRLEKKGYDKD